MRILPVLAALAAQAVPAAAFRVAIWQNADCTGAKSTVSLTEGKCTPYDSSYGLALLSGTCQAGGGRIALMSSPDCTASWYILPTLLLAGTPGACKSTPWPTLSDSARGISIEDTECATPLAEISYFFADQTCNRSATTPSDAIVSSTTLPTCGKVSSTDAITLTQTSDPANTVRAVYLSATGGADPCTDGTPVAGRNADVTLSGNCTATLDGAFQYRTSVPRTLNPATDIVGPVPAAQDLRCYEGLVGNSSVVPSETAVANARFCAVARVLCFSAQVAGCTAQMIADKATVGPYYFALEPDTAFTYATQYSNIYQGLTLCSSDLCNSPTSANGAEGGSLASTAAVAAAGLAAAALAWRV